MTSIYYEKNSAEVWLIHGEQMPLNHFSQIKLYEI